MRLYCDIRELDDSLSRTFNRYTCTRTMEGGVYTSFRVYYYNTRDDMARVLQDWEDYESFLLVEKFLKYYDKSWFSDDDTYVLSILDRDSVKELAEQGIEKGDYFL